MNDNMMTGQRWVAFGQAGAVGSIEHTDDGYTVRFLDDDEPRGTYPTLQVAKSALHAAMTPGSDWPEFREH
ncbi:methyltransferase [uncultured Schumannella sp.]|uniref:methyltransferase n=1 Tax=uncultured Schumannella sp. TaxID=1195956 RepID=UPI0025DA132D|nr:methyltransferase [uncultured Schumannella sp.]